MPQDSLRSAVYRSFVTCDDPKGATECGTIRKSKIGPKKSEGLVESRRGLKDLDKSCSFKEEEKMAPTKIPEGFHCSSSFQLMEVSRGAQKLNQVVDAWSSRTSFDGDTKEIAKDLLKGALDLQESLIMLGKLQEASNYMAKSKKKQERFNGSRFDEMETVGRISSGFKDHNYQPGFQKPRLSADGSSRDCFEELREAIREGLAKQNLLRTVSTKEKAYCDKRMMYLDADIASTSSSQSSMTDSQILASSTASVPSEVLQKKSSSGSNLIAKLMGIEEISSKTVQGTPHKQVKTENVKRRPAFEIDMPKPQFDAQKVHPNWREVTDFHETIPRKRFPNGAFLERFGAQSRRSNTSAFKKRFEDAPPIVLIKPLHFSSPEEAGYPRPARFIWDKGDLDTKRAFKTLPMKVQNKITDPGGGALNSNMYRKLKAEERPLRRLESGVKNLRGAQEKQEESITKANAKIPPNKSKSSVPVKHLQQNKQGKEKGDGIQKVTSHRRKPAAGVENVKFMAVSKSHDRSNGISAKEQKEGVGSITTRFRSSQHKHNNSSSLSRSTAPKTSLTSNNDNLVMDSLPAASVIEIAVCQCDDDKLIDQPRENDSEQLSETQIKDHEKDDQNAPHNVALMETTRGESCTKSAEEDSIGSFVSSDKKSSGNMEDMLLSSPSFIVCAEELFNVDPKLLVASSPMTTSTTNENRLLLDCAKELVQQKSLQRTQERYLRNFDAFVSLDQLVEEVCNEIESQRSCNKLVNEKLPAESLNAVLEGQLWCKGAVISSWDFAWRNGFSSDEIEQIVGDLEKMVCSELIESLFTDFGI